MTRDIHAHAPIPPASQIADALVVTLCSSVSLQALDECGILEREWSIYERLSPRYGRIILVSEGGDSDLELMKSDQFSAEIATALPAIMTSDRFLRVALTTLQKVPKLQNCSQESLCQALLDCASLGLEPDNRRAHLIPYGNKVQLIVDYKGVVELVLRNGDVRKIYAEIVHENDEFEFDRGEVTKHLIDYCRDDRGKAIAAYCIATLKTGEKTATVMTVKEINAIRDKAKSGNSGPWVDHWGEMAKKTVFKRLAKWLPMTPEVKAAAEYGDDPIINAKPVVAAPVFNEADFLPGVDEITMNNEPIPEGVNA
jgi:recombination protein RecT